MSQQIALRCDWMLPQRAVGPEAEVEIRCFERAGDTLATRPGRMREMRKFRREDWIQ